MDNYPGFSVPVCGSGLARAMRAQAHRFGAEFHTGDVDGFDLEGEVKSVAINDDLRHASALILAMGAVNRPLSVPGNVSCEAMESAPAPNATVSSSPTARSPSSAAATPPPRRPCFLRRWPAA